MSRGFIAFALALQVLAPSAEGQQQPIVITPDLAREFEADYKTGKWMNGRMWRIWTPEVRTYHVDGYVTGWQMAATISGNAEALKKVPQGFRLSELVDEIDAVFKQTENVRIPIWSVILLGMRKLSGELVGADFDKALRDARQRAAQ